jgi:hypothetical protein
MGDWHCAVHFTSTGRSIALLLNGQDGNGMRAALTLVDGHHPPDLMMIDQG